MMICLRVTFTIIIMLIIINLAMRMAKRVMIIRNVSMKDTRPVKMGRKPMKRRCSGIGRLKSELASYL